MEAQSALLEDAARYQRAYAIVGALAFALEIKLDAIAQLGDLQIEAPSHSHPTEELIDKQQQTKRVAQRALRRIMSGDTSRNTLVPSRRLTGSVILLLDA
jgi:hypothetical protein